MNLTPYLEDLERRIDPRVEDSLRGEWSDFCNGRSDSDPFTPRRTSTSVPRVFWPDVHINDAIEDFDLMAYHQLRLCSELLVSGDGGLLCVRCNYGTGILPTLFGARLYMMPRETATLPTSLPVSGGRQAVERLLDAGVPDVLTGLGARVFAMGERFRELFRPWPHISRYVSLYHPDCQGPMDVCELLRGGELFLELMDAPDRVEALLGLITETYIAFMERWQRLVPPSGDLSVHWSMMHRGTVMLRDDSATNLSPAMFERFIFPFDQKILERFGGGAIHFCGKGDLFMRVAAGLKGLHAVHMSQPEHNDLAVIFQQTVDRGITLIGMKPEAAARARECGLLMRGRVHVP